VTPGSVASSGLFVGDAILRIGNTDADRMTYAVAMETIKTSGDRLELYTSRTGLPANTQPISNNYSHSPHITSNDVADTRFDSFNQPPSHLYDGGHPQGNVGRPEPEIPKQQVSSPVVQPAQTPDAVLNIASRTPQDKRPWAYAPDIQSIQQQRQRVQRRNLPPTKVDSPRTRPTNQFASPQQYQPYQAYQPSQPYQPSQQYQPYQAYQPPQMTSHLQDGEVERNGDVGVGVGVGHESIYSGSEIPSKTFKLLQSFTSSAPNQPPSNTGLARAAQRRQRRREKLQIFDDLISDGTVEKSQEPEFDEAAYLAGRIPIIGSGSTKPVPPRSHAIARNESGPVEEEREDENKKPFDERAYLAGRIPLVSGGPIDPELFNLPIPDATSAAAAAADDVGEDGEEGRDENKKPFDERAYLAGRIPLVKGGTIDPTQFNVPERRVVKKYKDVNRPRLRQPFDEKSYLAGKLNILGETNDRPPRREAPTSIFSNNRSEDVKPSWCKGDEDMVSEDEYSEDSFLKGRIAIVRRSVDRELPQRRAQDVTGKARYRLERAAWQKGEPDDDGRGGICSDTEFDERAYLAGRWRGQHLAPDKEYSTDTETADAPSKTLRILRRSVSSERSTDEDWRCLASGDEASSDQEAPYDCYMYQGRNIPSKIFSRLKRTMDRKAAAEHKTRSDDPIERLREKSLEQVGIDVDTAIERMEIGQHDPDTYMKLLKQSVEQNDHIRIEPDNEVTDF
jgi:hypothetical protein